jgi:hypothetical protein
VKLASPVLAGYAAQANGMNAMCAVCEQRCACVWDARSAGAAAVTSDVRRARSGVWTTSAHTARSLQTESDRFRFDFRVRCQVTAHRCHTTHKYRTSVRGHRAPGSGPAERGVLVLWGTGTILGTREIAMSRDEGTWERDRLARCR